MTELLLLLDLQLIELSHVGVNQLNIGVFSWAGFSDSGLDEYALLLPDDEGGHQKQEDEDDPRTSLRHVDINMERSNHLAQIYIIMSSTSKIRGNPSRLAAEHRCRTTSARVNWQFTDLLGFSIVISSIAASRELWRSAYWYLVHCRLSIGSGIWGFHQPGRPRSPIFQYKPTVSR